MIAESSNSLFLKGRLPLQKQRREKRNAQEISHAEYMQRATGGNIAPTARFAQRSTPLF